MPSALYRRRRHADLRRSSTSTAKCGNNLNRVVVPKGNTGRLAYVTEFVEDAKSSGLIQKAIDRAGPPGIKVAPPGDAK